MPSLDSSRGRFKFADRHIAVFAHLLEKETPPAELHHSLGELQQIGLVGAEGELSPLLLEFLTTLARPLVMIQAEVTGQHGTLVHGVVVGQDAVYSHDAWPGDEESEYVPIEPKTLVWELARKVKLRRGEQDEPASAGVTEITTTMGALDAVFAALESGASDDLDAARATAVSALAAASDLTDPELTALVELTLSLDSTWRVTTAWGDERAQAAGESVRSIAVWDCGPHGHWLRVQPEEPVKEGQVGPESTLRLVRSSAGEVWDKLADLLPDKAELVGTGASA